MGSDWLDKLDQLGINQSWWKSKLAGLGYNPKPINLYKIEGICPMCGHGNYLWPLSGTFDSCERCFGRFANYNGVKAKIQLSTSVYGVSCVFCASKVFRYVHVIDGRFCSKCFWSKLGKRKGRLKDSEGGRV